LDTVLKLSEQYGYLFPALIATANMMKQMPEQVLEIATRIYELLANYLKKIEEMPLDGMPTNERKKLEGIKRGIMSVEPSRQIEKMITHPTLGNSFRAEMRDCASSVMPNLSEMDLGEGKKDTMFWKFLYLMTEIMETGRTKETIGEWFNEKIGMEKSAVYDFASAYKKAFISCA
jgi:hypothetical protein